MQLAAPVSSTIKSTEIEDENYNVLQVSFPNSIPLLIKSEHHWKCQVSFHHKALSFSLYVTIIFRLLCSIFLVLLFACSQTYNIFPLMYM